MKKHLPLLFIVFFTGILQFQLFSEQVLLTDDLHRVVMTENNHSFFPFLKDFINHTTMTSRPISGLLYAPSIYLIKYFGVDIYYINYVFYLISLVMIYKVISKLYDDNVATLGTFIYSLLPIGTSIVFSPIMMNSALATIFYCLSLLSILKISENSEKRESLIYILLSSIFFLLSVLSYEIFIPLILVNAYFIRSEKNYLKLLYIAITLILIFGYRQVLEPTVFSNYYHRSESKNIFDFQRDIIIIKDIILTFFAKLPYSILRGIFAIKYYSIFDFLLLISQLFLGYFLLFKNEISFSPKHSFLKIFVFGFIISLLIFFVSYSRPSIWGFNNRNLGASKFFIALIIISLIPYIKHLYSKFFKIGLFGIISMISATTISTKNAWIYSHKTNNEIFAELKKHLPNTKRYTTIALTFDKTLGDDDRKYFLINDSHFVFFEPIYDAPWERHFIKKQNNIPTNFHIIHHTYNYPKHQKKGYYLFDYKTKTMEYIKENP